MYPKSVDIASLISSRICHDLASPLGAISNGLELLELSGVPASPEYTLLSDSVENAAARINFFRFAFGPAGGNSLVGESEVRNLIAKYYGGARIKVLWLVKGDLPRAQVKLSLLYLSCLETLLPVGGTITVTKTASGWHIEAADPRLVDDQNLLCLLGGQGDASELKPSQIQFELVRQYLCEEGIFVNQARSEGRVSLSYDYPAS